MNGATLHATPASANPRAPGQPSRAYGLGRLDHQGGARRNPQRHMGHLAAAPASERMTFVADYDRGFSQSADEWRPDYAKAWPLDMGA